MSDKKVRVRFAPSPTGNLHIGGMRTALFNWLFAKHNDGTFLIRVEDTDLERSKSEYVKAQLEALDWCGLQADEELVYQTQNINRHNEVLKSLLSSGHVYKCVCSPEEVEARVRAAGNDDQYFKYDGHCRGQDLSQADKSFVIRFAVPKNGDPIVVEDLIRGTVTFELDQVDDFIIARSDGSPTYNFVVVVDDHDMAITHVIRGEDHLSNTPKQILLYRACGFALPKFAHIPLIMGTSGQRLSKRDGAVDVLHYRKEGFLHDALLNYIVRLGWSHGDQEKFSKSELVDLFTLKAVGKKSAVFDIEKLQWLNGVYMKERSSEELIKWITSDVEPNLKDQLIEWDLEQWIAAVDLYKERVKTGRELVDALQMLYDGPLDYNKDDFKKWITQDTRKHLKAMEELIEDSLEFSKDAISKEIKKYCEKNDLKLVTIAQPLRIALVGSASAPGVFDMLALIGQEESIMRIEALQTAKVSD